MADKPISGLTAAESVGDSDLFVLEQDGQAKKLTGQTLMHDLAVELAGHGGIASIAKTGTSGLVDTYTITFTDGTNSTFSVTNGDSIDHISTETVTPSDPSRAQDIKVNVYLTSAPSTIAYYFIVPGGNTGAQGIQGIQGIQGEAGARAWMSSSAPINADGVYVFTPAQISTPAGITATPQVGDMIWWTNNYYFITNIAYSGGQVNSYGCNNTYAIFPGNYVNNVYYADYGIDYSGRLQEAWEGGKALFCIMPQQQQDDPQNILALTNVTENYQGGSGDTPHTRFIFSAVHHTSNGNVLEVAISGDSAINSWSTATYSLSGGGSSDYDDLTDKPQINGVTLSGNKTTAQLSLDQVWWATYGTTSRADIIAAKTAGKIVMCEYNDGSDNISLFRLVNITDDGYCYFESNSTGLNEMERIEVDDQSNWMHSKWTAPTLQLTGTPAALGTASRGSAAMASRSDHVHPMPTAADVGAAPAITEVTVSTAGAVTQALDAGKMYHFTGALTALTITLNAAASGQIAHYHFDFDCGSTAPTVTIPNTVTMPSGGFEASKHYEVDILNNYGAVLSWANS